MTEHDMSSQAPVAQPWYVNYRKEAAALAYQTEAAVEKSAKAATDDVHAWEADKTPATKLDLMHAEEKIAEADKNVSIAKEIANETEMMAIHESEMALSDKLLYNK